MDSCRICLETTNEPFIKPCKCNDFVHKSCIDIWRNQSSNIKNFTHCSVCKTQFTTQKIKKDKEKINTTRENILLLNLFLGVIIIILFRESSYLFPITFVIVFIDSIIKNSNKSLSFILQECNKCGDCENCTIYYNFGELC